MTLPPHVIEERSVATGLEPLFQAAFAGQRGTEELLDVLREAVKAQTALH